MRFDYDNVVKIGDIAQYLRVLNPSVLDQYCLFRGQVNSDWELSPSLERFYKNLNCSTRKFGYDSWSELENKLIEEFISQSKPYMSFVPENRLEWLVHAQHHGLPTSLLDWTTNPLKALFFAVEHSSYDNAEGTVIFASGVFSSTEEIEEERLKGKEDLFCFQPKHINERIVAQEGCFTLYPLPEEFNPFAKLSAKKQVYSDFDVVKKIIIPSECKSTIRKELATLGITKRVIYPGLDSVAESIKRKLLDGNVWY